MDSAVEAEVGGAVLLYCSRARPFVLHFMQCNTFYIALQPVRDLLFQCKGFYIADCNLQRVEEQGFHISVHAVQ